jgi:hypothetical protein
MKPARKLRRVAWLLALAACLFSPAGPLAQGAGIQTGYSTNAADQVECKRQLNIIYGAIQQYREQHGGQLPNKLSDLTPHLIHNPEVLICPYVRKRGGLRTWTKRFHDHASDPYTSYSYEMPPEPLDQSHWRGLPKKTWREYKDRQKDKLGPVVPIVRCLDHRPCLNLSIGAQIYESGDYWEGNFSTDDHLLTIAKLFPVANRPPARTDFPPRDPKASPRLLDLTAYYNGTLTNDWQGFAGNHLASLPTGIRSFDGVEFDVRGVIQLRGEELPTVFPTRVEGIEVRQKCSRIHFLHAVIFTHKSNTQARYVFHYTNGAVQEFPVIYGQHIADWWGPPGDASKLTKATVAWMGQNEASKAYGMELRLYHSRWENPLMDVEIATITFDAEPRDFLAGPFVLAITLE